MSFTRAAEAVIFVFLAHHVKSAQDAAQKVSEDCGPVAADEVQLVKQGIRMTECGLAQIINERESFHRRFGAGKSVQVQDQFVVVTLLDKFFFVKELSGQLHGCRIAVGDPQHHDFFDRVITVFQSLRGLCIKILTDGLFIFQDGKRRELFTEFSQYTFKFFCSQFFVQPVIGFHIQTGCILFAVFVHERMHDLINETQSVQFTDGHRFPAFFRADCVDLSSELTYRTNIRENHVAVVREQFLRKVIMFSGFAGDVKFHICTP